MEFNRNFGKILDNNTLKYAPADLTTSQLEEGEWLPIAHNGPSIPDDQEYVSILTGWRVVDGHIEKKFERRKRIELRKEYSQELVIQHMGENYPVFIQYLQDNYPELLNEFQGSSVYLQECSALNQCFDIYCQLFNLSKESVYQQLDDSIVQR